jgi:hypothetical protein
MLFGRTVTYHEAAHAVVARNLGLRVAVIRLDWPGPGDGVVRWRKPIGRPEMLREELAAWLAPEVLMRELRPVDFPHADAGQFAGDRSAVGEVLADLLDDLPADRAATAAEAMLHAGWQLAAETLAAHGGDLEHVAHRLQRCGYWDPVSGWRRISPRPVPAAPAPAAGPPRTGLARLVAARLDGRAA